ncbi:MAG: biotin/lipoyl-binding protein [Tissierellia bacterium]|jgi:biotin carboxyl carrier protein|nr:biotin/lipoyl-binding protein [Tissierellia bacterium]MDD3226626.1 biotin/lipoyl-binding protein [Tissierellia bacterium]MDD3752292.1 biotin/lipoyl-binding protein [Tissierellia bacterium]MDD4046809.1 biotin/lipoyl-binding protein [Tissierellia bacterium]MDD4678830.1 biotin/lipoyl-binding protein [Tissierellia bacterium]
MKTYLITVNGVTYEVQAEEVRGNQQIIQQVVQQPAPAPQPAAAPAPAPKPAPVVKEAPKPVPTGGTQITSPMPGSIFKLNVKPGDSVKKGDVVLILEAMKMENEIFAAEDAVVSSVEVKEGATVNTGDVLVILE